MQSLSPRIEWFAGSPDIKSTHNLAAAEVELRIMLSALKQNQ
jgi:hypothetical protein